MIIAIDTTQNDNIYLALKEGNNIISEKNIPARRKQAEVLLIEIDKLLKKNKITKKKLSKIEVANTGGSFTSLRIGVITANALGYGLGIKVQNSKLKTQNERDKFNIVEPIYKDKYKINET